MTLHDVALDDKFDLGKERLVALSLVHITTVQAEGHLVEIGVHVLRRNPVMGADVLALEQGPHALNAVGGHAAPHILATAMGDALMVVIVAEVVIAAVFVGVDGRALFDVFRDDMAKGVAARVVDNARAHIAVALLEAHDDSL